MRIAVAHEWLTNWAGSEKVAEQLVDVSAASELVVAIADRRLAAERFPNLTVTPLWPSRMPAATTRWPRYALPMVAAWATARIKADALLVSSHFAAHFATRLFDGPSIVYYHTPARMLWRPEMELARLPVAARAVVRDGVLPIMRRWDRRAARHPTVVLANSHAVARRIAEAYGRQAQILHPPVDVARWLSVPRRDRSHLLWVGRLVAYKRPDLAVEAARLTGLPLMIVGDGPERARLEYGAPSNVRFLGRAPDATVRDAMAHARALVFPGEEDFGIAPIEALAAGVPVVAFGRGGVLDYLRAGENGLLTATQDVATFARALRRAWTMTWDERAIRRASECFSIERFRIELGGVLDSVLRRGWRRREVVA